MPASAPLSAAISGPGYLLRGLRMWVTSPRLMLLGALPALIVGLLYTAAIVIFVVNLDALAVAVTPFADSWTEPAAIAVRFGAGLALAVVVVFMAIITFAGVTLAVGDPFYERIWREVETRLGDAPVEFDEPFWVGVRRAVGTAIRLLALTVLVAVLIFATSLIPLVGQILAPMLGTLLGGWILTLETSGFAFEARRVTVRDRRRMLGARRARTLGFGVVTYLLFLIPLGAVIVMPAAVAGATMLARDSLPRR